MHHFHRSKRLILPAAALLLVFFLTACSGGGQQETPAATPGAQPAQTQPESGAGGTQTLRVLTHDSFAVSEEVLAIFESENQAKVEFVMGGDVGTALNRAILSKDNPVADVFYGVDNTFLSRALEEGIFQPYESPLLGEIPDRFELDPTHGALPVDFGDVCLNYDKVYFEEEGLVPPTSLEDIAKPDYAGLTVVENPATSSPGRAFLLATIGHFGEDGYLQYWEQLVANDVLVVNDWETAYYGEFTRAGGSRPIVVSYGSSPAFEVIYAEDQTESAPSAAVTGNTSCFRQIEFAGILQGAQNRELAEKWIDFMLGVTFQEDIPLQMFVFPVNENATLDPIFEANLEVPEQTAEVSPEAIAANQGAWIDAWTETVLR